MKELTLAAPAMTDEEYEMEIDRMIAKMDVMVRDMNDRHEHFQKNHVQIMEMLNGVVLRLGAPR